MFLEIIPELYDAKGRKSYKPHLKKGLHPPTYPFGRYVQSPMGIQCRNLEDVRTFLRKCRQMHDIEAFGKKEYWSPPDEFEQNMRGDCDDFALWTWRQLIQMGFPARLVAGRVGRYKHGHAWVTFNRDGKHYLAEPTMAFVGQHLPSLYLLKYHPIYSVAWDGKNTIFYSHAETRTEPGFWKTLGLVVPWLWFWTSFWTRTLPRLVIFGPRHLWRRMRGKDRPQGSGRGVQPGSDPAKTSKRVS